MNASVSIVAAVASLLAAFTATLAWRATERSVGLQWVAQREERLASLVAALRGLVEPSSSWIRLDEEASEREEQGAADRASLLYMPTPDWVHQDRRQRWADAWRELDHAVFRAQSALVGTINLPPDSVAELESLFEQMSKGPSPVHLVELGERIEIARGWLGEVHTEAVLLVAPGHYRRAIDRLAGWLYPERLVHWFRDRVTRRPR